MSPKDLVGKLVMTVSVNPVLVTGATKLVVHLPFRLTQLGVKPDALGAYVREGVRFSTNVKPDATGKVSQFTICATTPEQTAVLYDIVGGEVQDAHKALLAALRNALDGSLVVSDVISREQVLEVPPNFTLMLKSGLARRRTQ